MKTTIKMIMIIAVMAITFMGCKKEPGPKGDTGATGAQGPSGPSAKTFTFTLTFDPGETYETFSGVTGFTPNDVLLVYVFSANYGSDYYTQLPYIIQTNSVNFWPEFSETTGNLFINTTWADGTSGSPWATSSTKKFKAVLIHSSIYKAYPNVNWANYDEAKTSLQQQD